MVDLGRCGDTTDQDFRPLCKAQKREMEEIIRVCGKYRGQRIDVGREAPLWRASRARCNLVFP